MNQLSVDFYKKFRLPQPHVGLVNKITSPKGIRCKESESYTSYQLHSDLCDVYAGNECTVKPGLYWVLDISKDNSTMQLQWYHYIFVVDDEKVYPVAEYLDQSDSWWITQAIPKVIKPYFQNQELPPIKLTLIKMPKPIKTDWHMRK